MNKVRNYIDRLCDRMREGQSLCISRDLFMEAYPCGFPSIYNTHLEAFLSSKIGSSWGAWEIRQNPDTGNYIISKHYPGHTRVYVDPDRAHLYRRDAQGYLSYIDVLRDIKNNEGEH